MSEGTARRAALDGIPTAGKTGTTNAYRDAWFVGYTGNYTCAVWYGNDDYSPTNRMTGGSCPPRHGTTSWSRPTRASKSGNFRGSEWARSCQRQPAHPLPPRTAHPDRPISSRGHRPCSPSAAPIFWCGWRSCWTKQAGAQVMPPNQRSRSLQAPSPSRNSFRRAVRMRLRPNASSECYNQRTTRIIRSRCPFESELR